MKTLAAIPADRSASFVRAAFASASGGLRGANGENILASRWPNDVAARHLIRGAVAAASTGDEAWAGALANAALGEFIASLAPVSAASKLIDMGSRIDLRGSGGSISYPARNGPPSVLGWVAEGAPIAASARSLTAIPLEPRKIASLVTWSHELDRHSNARKIFEQMLAEDVSYSLDQIYFSNTAPSVAAHGGLMHNVTPLSGSTSGGVSAMTEDIASVLSAVAGPGSTGKLAVALSIRNAAMLGVYQPDLAQGAVAILPTSALGDDEIVGLDAGSLVHAVDTMPDLEASTSAAIHLADPALPISTPGVLATPVMSAFQQAAVVLRCVFDLAFAARRQGAISWINSADWSTAPAVTATARRSK